ncbi:MAG TPA: ATP-binding protein [Bacteroidota bacterium]
MVFKNFHTALVARVVVLSLTILLCLFLFLWTGFYVTATVTAALVLYQIWALIRSVDKTNEELTRFLRTITYADFSQTFSGRGHGATFDRLNEAFAGVIGEFRKARTETEEHFRYLQTIIQHIGVGLISFTPDGEVELLNTAAKRLLHVPHLRNIHDLGEAARPLVDAMLKLRAGDRTLVRVEEDGEPQQLALNATEFRMHERPYTLVSLQNIRSELEEKEMEAWQNLIRVLTHEIMNSITPISSLASTVNGLLREEPGAPARGTPDPATMHDVREAVHTIEKRSEGLLHFVDAYRNLTRVPKPKFAVFRVTELFARVQRLMTTHIPGRPVSFQTTVEPESLELTADPEQIEQVLINLLLNALQAVEGTPHACIELRGKLDSQGRTVIEVCDNGPGIPGDLQEKIFVPFFTTKKGGTGIGLSLSRQIMRLHHGSISVSSVPNDHTIFTLRF